MSNSTARAFVVFSRKWIELGDSRIQVYWDADGGRTTMITSDVEGTYQLPSDGRWVIRPAPAKAPVPLDPRLVMGVDAATELPDLVFLAGASPSARIVYLTQSLEVGQELPLWAEFISDRDLELADALVTLARRYLAAVRSHRERPRGEA